MGGRLCRTLLRPQYCRARSAPAGRPPLPRVDLTRRGLSPGGLVVARTLQQHGCYIGDNSGSASAVKAEQAGRTRDPWKGLLRQNSLRGITWDDFVVLPRGWQ